MDTLSTLPDSSRAPGVSGAHSMESVMEFTEAHRASLLAEMRANFPGADVTLGVIDMSYASRDKTDVPCVYVEFFVGGERYLADVCTGADGSVDWVY